MTVGQNHLNEALFLTTVLRGPILLIAAMMVARLIWRPDVPPYSLSTRSTDVLLHPEKYARPEVCFFVRALSVLGVVSLMVAVFTFIREAILQFAS